MKWSWRFVWELTALARVENPWQYSLRQLTWRAYVNEMTAWDRTAHLCLNQPWFGSAPTLLQVHPIRAAEDRKQRKLNSDDREFWAGLEELVDEREKKAIEEKKKAVVRLTEEQIQARWRAFIRRGGFVEKEKADE